MRYLKMKVFWNDDIEIVQSFVIKTIKQFKKTEGELSTILCLTTTRIELCNNTITRNASTKRVSRVITKNTDN